MSAADVKPARAAKSASYACTSEPIATPRFVRAPEAVELPVPPAATATSVADQTPVVTVPTAANDVAEEIVFCAAVVIVPSILPAMMFA